MIATGGNVSVMRCRTGDNMNLETGYDVTVVGGGITGLAIARLLALRGMKTLVIDAGREIPPATRAAAGMLAPSFEIPCMSPGFLRESLYDFGISALRQWSRFAPALEEESGIRIDRRSGGILGVAVCAAGAKALEEQYAFLETRGANAVLLDSVSTGKLEPALSGAVVSSLHAPDEGQVDPRLVLKALCAAFMRAGGTRIDARVIRGDVRSASGFVLTLSDGRRMETSRLVLATGAALPVCIPGIAHPPVRPVKGEALALAMPSPPAPVLRHVVRAPGAYLCPKAGGRLVIGATEREGLSGLTVDRTALAGLRRSAARVVKGIAALREVESWAGLRPATPDGAPVFGACPGGPEGLFYALGHYRNGILFAPAGAGVMAGIIAGGKTDPDAARFRPDRFSRQEPQSLPETVKSRPYMRRKAGACQGSGRLTDRNR